MKFKLCLPLDATILFWRRYTCHTCSGINAAKLAQIVASLIEGREHKMGQAWFMSLAFLMLLCNITKKRQKPASDTVPTVSENVGSLFPTQFERVNWLNRRCTHAMIHVYIYKKLRYTKTHNQMFLYFVYGIITRMKNITKYKAFVVHFHDIVESCTLTSDMMHSPAEQ